MSSNTKKVPAVSSAVLFAAWLVVIAAGVNPGIESATALVPIAYQAE
jgi:hypothetical protein